MSYYLKVLHELKVEGVDIADFKDTKRTVIKYKIQNSSSNSKVWLISFTDILALMLTFFVLLFSMSEPELESLSSPNSLVSPRLEMNQNLGAPQKMGDTDSINLNRVNFNKALDLGYLKNIIEKQQKDYPPLSKMQIIEDKDNQRMILILPEDLLFTSGSYQLSKNGQNAIRDAAHILKNIKNGIEIVGHTDNQVAESVAAPSHMLLSLKRARTVASGLKASGYERPVPYQGYGNALYQNLPKEWVAARRMSTARRVDIIVHAHDGSRQKRFGVAGVNTAP